MGVINITYIDQVTGDFVDVKEHYDENYTPDMIVRDYNRSGDVVLDWYFWA